jgi:hypothetical protein
MKIDLKRELKALYTASAKAVALIDVPPLRCLIVDGQGHPDKNPAFQQAIELLYSASFAVKFASKKADPARDWGIMPLEGLWWGHESGDWHWSLLIVQPGFVTAADVRRAVGELGKKKRTDAYTKVRLELLREGKCVQTMHIGPYDAEQPTIERMSAFAREQGYAFYGKHHEIYVSDPRRVAPEKLKTILRYPVKKGGRG